jgi:dTMP kinase
VASFSFPLYDGNPFSRAVADYLNGEFGAADEVHPELAALLYAGDRFHARPRIVAALQEHDLVVCDRYVASNQAHQGAKLTGAARRRLLDWLEEVEYGEFALPRPQLVLLLDAPVALARRLVGRKAARGYTTLEADIHEADAAHSGATREVYLELAERDGWRVVSTAGDDGAARDVDDIAAEIWSAVEPLLR